jgi:hypothetical protein
VVLARLDRILPRLAPRGRPDLFSRVLFMPIGGCGSILQPSPGEYIAGTSEEYLDPTAGSTVSKRANWPPLTASPTNGTRPGHGIYSIDFLDGRPPLRQLYSCPPHRAARPNGARLWGTSGAKPSSKDPDKGGVYRRSHRRIYKGAEAPGNRLGPRPAALVRARIALLPGDRARRSGPGALNAMRPSRRSRVSVLSSRIFRRGRKLATPSRSRWC